MGVDLSRITTDSKVMAGKPVIKGTRLTVDFMATCQRCIL